MNMFWLCLILLCSAASDARPSWSKGLSGHSEISWHTELHQEQAPNLHHTLKDLNAAVNQGVQDVQGFVHQTLNSVAKGTIGDSNTSENPSQERINLHHSLKDVHNAASKAVMDAHKYIHQELFSVAKKHLKIITTPLVKVMAPVFYYKDRLNSMTGTRKPSTEEEISAWCPTCQESTSSEQSGYPGNWPSHDEVPCKYPNCLSVEAPTESNPVNVEQPSYPTSVTQQPMGTLEVTENLRSDNFSMFGHTSMDFIFPVNYEKQTKLTENPKNENDLHHHITEDASDSKIDIRFGNGQA